MEGILAINIPSTLLNSRHNLPWMNRNLKRLIRKKGRRFKKAKKSGMDEDRARLLQKKITAESSQGNHSHSTLYLYSITLHCELPTKWTQANVAPIFKKGSKLQAVNYRPVPLTCITCKLFEHIICKHILAHLEDHKITDIQHGFRS